MGDYSDEGEFWAGRKYQPSESDVVTSDAVTTPPVPPLPIVATAPEVVASGDGDCFVKPKPLEAWLGGLFPKSSFATRISAPTPCAAKEPVGKPSVVFACP